MSDKKTKYNLTLNITVIKNKGKNDLDKFIS